MKHEKTIEQTYQVLSEIEHIRKRTGMWAGSPVAENRERYVYDQESNGMVKRQIVVIPALLKIISEVLDNSVDEHKRNPNKLTMLKVQLGTADDENEIVVYDNGGIPVVMHQELGMYVPEVIFGQLRSGSNYNDEDEQSLAGTHGLGSKITNILSEYFVVETADGSKSFKQEFNDGMNKRSDPIVHSSKQHYTRITFKPDYKFFNLTELNADHRAEVVKRLYDIAGCNPRLAVFLNGEQLKIKSFKDYIQLYSSEFVFEEYPNWQIAVAPSNGFEQTSFVNTIETYVGGTHVDYVMTQIVNSLREFFKKRHRVDVKPSDIKSHLHVFINCNINRPKFSSQTKEHMISAISDFGTSVEISEKFIKKIIASPVIQSVLDWVEAKAKAAELAEMRKKNRETDKVNLKRIPKFHDATEKDRDQVFLILAEGDSAASSIMGARDPRYHACFPLRGRPINVSASPLAKVRENAEFENIRNLVGLKYGETADLKNLNFKRIVIASDADEFGHSIAGLIVNMFYRLWPEIVKAGLIYRLITPIVLVETPTETIEFFSESEFLEWRDQNSNLKYKYSFLKGLGSSEPKQFKKYMSNLDKYLVQFVFDETAQDDLDLCFSKLDGAADRRKAWLGLE